MTIQLQQLTAPWFHTFTGTSSDLTDFAWSIARSGLADFAVRVVRGTKMRTLAALFDEMAAALQFPDYFGENWDALDECLADLSWLPAAGYVLLIRESTTVLSQEDPMQLPTFVSVLANAANQWSEPVEQGEAWDRPGKPFHIVLHGAPQDAVKLRNLVEQTGESVGEVSKEN